MATKFTAQFWRWFGKSQVVNEDFQPRVVYHGTVYPKPFTEFLVGRRPLLTEDESAEIAIRGSGADPLSFVGPHFTDSFAVAGRFAKGLYGEREYVKGEHGRIIPVYLRIEKPFRGSESEVMELMLREKYDTYSIERELENWPDYEHDEDVHVPIDFDELSAWYEKDPVFRSAVNKHAMLMEAQTDEDNFFELAEEMGNSLRERLEKKGHDGIIYTNKVEGGEAYIVFDSAQVKSAYNPRPSSVGRELHNPFFRRRRFGNQVGY